MVLVTWFKSTEKEERAERRRGTENTTRTEAGQGSKQKSKEGCTTPNAADTF
jgi:hypothetical protein